MMFESLLKAAVGVVVEIPVAVVKDVVTLGGATTNEDSAIIESVGKISKNISNAVNPENKGEYK
tara:strand:+ start:4 stop:195 length:192 start_codon:yes stop_codon:yes gene_type:complete